ncbi:MAG: hypothetical protein HGB11_15745 [Chlorobiales bacterium]|nr:hypothetical protein [Chlorobiales bacterium]
MKTVAGAAASEGNCGGRTCCRSRNRSSRPGALAVCACAFSCTPLLLALGVRYSLLVSTPEEALARKFSEKSLPLAFDSEELDRMESSGLDFYRRVRDGYLALHESQKERIMLIDAQLSPTSIHELIVNRLSTPAFQENILQNHLSQ